jgi:formyl-CoA transferase
MVEAGVPAGPVMSIADIVRDPQFQARGMIARSRDENGIEVAMSGIVPKLRTHPGTPGVAAGRIGRDTEAVLGELGVRAEQPSR